MENETPKKRSKRKESSPQARGSRNENPVSPFQRIEACIGIDGIKKKFAEALAVALDLNSEVPSTRFKFIPTPDVPLPLTLDNIVIHCKVKSNVTKGYPSIKIRLQTAEHLEKLCKTFSENQTEYDQSSVPLDLHRLAALSNEKWDTDRIGDHAIHRCHNKSCFNPEHVYFGTNDTNKSTEFCPVYILYGDTYVNCCYHSPTCLVPGARCPVAPTTI